MSSNPSRVAFFKESLSTLHTAATKGFHSLEETAGREVETYRLFELPGDQCYVASRTMYMPDGYSQSIYPEDPDKTLVPVVVHVDVLIFVVDNGPSVAPSNTLVQMLLVRLRQLLNIDKVVQKSFAEYNSKRNFVERVHAVENEALSKHGPFDAHQIHQTGKTGSLEHRQNITAMAEEIQTCLNSGVLYHGKPLEAFRATCDSNFVFDDEKELKNFLSLSESQKAEFSDLSYHPKQTKLLAHLCAIWNVSMDYEHSYYNDYLTICCQNKTSTGSNMDFPTVYKDKYTFATYRNDLGWKGQVLDPFERQPLPDYIRWFSTGGELHYLPYEKRRSFPTGPWDQCPGLFLPTKVLELCCKVFPCPPSDLFQDIGLLAWLSINEVTHFYQTMQEKTELTLSNDRDRFAWSHHQLYRTKSKEELAKLCRDMKIQSNGNKHELVRNLAENSGQCQPHVTTIYNGELDSIPKQSTLLSKFSVGQLRDIFHYHGFYCLGSKEELVLRVLALSHGRFDVTFNREIEGLEDLITVAEGLVMTELKECISEDTSFYRLRSTSICPKAPREASRAAQVGKNILAVRFDKPDDLPKLFERLRNNISVRRECLHDWNESFGSHSKGKQAMHHTPTPADHSYALRSPLAEELHSRVTRVGAQVRVRWSEDDIKGSDWKSGWYRAVVQDYIEDEDQIGIFYDCNWMDVWPVITSGRIH